MIIRVDRKTSSKIQFPAITICNTNTFPKTIGLRNLTNDVEKIAETIVNTTTGSFSIHRLRYLRGLRYRAVADDTQSQAKLQSIPLFIPKLQDSCLFGLKHICNLSMDFVSTVSPVDGGDCYTFNYDGKFFQQMNGVTLGLSMILFLNQSDYIPAIGDDQGAGEN